MLLFLTQEKNLKKITLTTKILLALALGLITGVILYPFREVPFIQNYIIGFLFKLVGKTFISAIKMMVVPLVFVSLTCGSASMGDVKKLGRIGSKSLLFYLVTTAIAISIAIILSTIVGPGLGFSIPTDELVFSANAKPELLDVIINMIPTNPFNSLANGNMLQIIIFSILLGTSLTILGDKAEKVTELFNQLNEVVLKLVEMIMLVAPYGVFALISKTFSELGYSAMVPLIKYMLCVVGALVLHALVTYQGLFFAFTKLNPIKFIKNFAPAMATAFSTASSNATLPVTIETVEERVGVSKKLASFTLPLGATINMDGTAIMQGVATVFISQAYQIDLSIADYLTVILTATLASIGTAGVPGVGLIMLSMVLTQVGLPVEAVAIIMGIDRLLDMARTAINICGDAVCTTIIAKQEGELDIEVFNSKNHSF